MTNLPDGLLGKILALGICAMLAAVAYLALIQPLLGLYEDGEQRLQERMELVQRLQGSVRDLPRLRAQAAQWHDKSSNGELLLAGTGDTVAAAALQSALKGLVEDGGASLTSAEVLPPQTQDKFRRIAIRVSFTGDLTLLTSVLRGVETAHPVMFVDNLEIHGADGGDTDLAVAFDVYGFRSL